MSDRETFYLPRELPRVTEPEPTTPVRRSCNRHDDCDAAEVKRFGKTGYYSNFHCHSDDCEDCFGK